MTEKCRRRHIISDGIVYTVLPLFRVGRPTLNFLLAFAINLFIKLNKTSIIMKKGQKLISINIFIQIRKLNIRTIKIMIKFSEYQQFSDMILMT